MTRTSWDDYFLKIAADVSERATCDRLHVGCVLVRDKAILSTGYNGSPRGLPHCDEVGHDMVEGHCVRAVHAESNAIAHAARFGARTEGSTAYVTATPCWQCFRSMINAGVVGVVYVVGRYALDPRVTTAATTLGIGLAGVGAGVTAPASNAAC